MIVLDSSAVLALLLDERGTDVVAPLTQGAELSIVNMCEVLTRFAAGGIDPDAIYPIVMSYDIRISAFREAHAIEAARLRPVTARLGLSLGGRACLALARLSGKPILTADRRMAQADVGLDIRMIR